MDEEVKKLAQIIEDTADEVLFGENVLSVTMDIPPARDCAPDALAKALLHILTRYGIEPYPEFFSDVADRVKTEMVFIAPARERGLRPRTIQIDLSAGGRSVTILGEKPIAGADGFNELLFDSSTRPGRLLPGGAIDFRQINRYPQVNEGEDMIRSLDPTPGLAGTDVHGFSIPPEPGKSFPFEPGDGLASRAFYDSELDRHGRIYSASRSGIVAIEFERDIRDASCLKRISVVNRIEVGDIDFGTGNIGDGENEFRCAADVSVKGDVKGFFSVAIEGSMDVKGTVEGKDVDVSRSLVARSVMSSIRAGNVIETGSALNARLDAGELVIVRREALGSNISAPTVLFEPSGSPMVLCGACRISTRRLSMRKVSVRNLVQVDMGKDLFQQRERLQMEKERAAAAVEVIQSEIRSRISVLAEKVRNALCVVRPPDDLPLRELFSMILAVLSGKKTHERQRTHIDAWCAEYGARHPAVFRQALEVVRLIGTLAEASDAVRQREEQDREIVRALRSLYVEVSCTVTGAGRLVIRCNGKEQEWCPDPCRRERAIQVRLNYDPEEDRLVEMDAKAGVSSEGAR